MLDKLKSLLFSTRLMAVLFIVFAASMGVGTFLEDAYGTTAARIWIYNTWWFEAIMVFFAINFCGNIFRYRLYKKEKWATLLLHLSFILIIVGAFITRYISYEGVMPIREGETTATFLSEKTYITIFLDGEINGEPRRRIISEAVELAEATSNDFVIDTDYNKQPVSIAYKNYIQGAEMGLVPSEEGNNYLKIVEAGDGDRHDHFIEEGEVSNIHNVLIAFNKPTKGAINITYKNDDYFIESPFEGSYLRMADQQQGLVFKDSVQPLMLRSLYQTAGMQFVIPDPVIKGSYDVVPIEVKGKGQQDALILDVSTNGETKEIKLLGGKGYSNDMDKISLGGLDMYFTYGSKRMELPFSLKLNDFIAEKYPGTQNVYKSYMSKVDIIDNDTSRPYDIYMNHILDHKGYRFFQASFDPDEKGTVLSVNHDRWGTLITYAGYMLLYLGLMLILFTRGSRFKDLEKMLSKIKAKKKTLTISITLLVTTFSFAQDLPGHNDHLQTLPSKAELDSIIKANIVPKEHAAKFGSIVIQDERGRMKPVNTFSSELLRKISKKDTYEKLNADQVFVSMVENPLVWYSVPIIEIDWKNDSIRKILGVPKSAKKVSLIDLFEPSGAYKLDPYLEKASSTNTPSQFEKEFLKTHEKFYLLNQALGGGILKVFPVPGNEDNKWVSVPELNEFKFTGMDSVYTRQIIPIYRQSLQEARKTGDYSKPDQYVASIKSFQKKFGSEVMPTDKKVKAEIALNKYDIFRTLYRYYGMFGLLLMIFVILRIFKESKIVKVLINGTIGIVTLLFILHTAGLIIRWYVSGHAPWSDAYESMIYVAWATLAIGFAFGRRSNLTIAATTFVAAIILFFAHQNWTDPAIANLQPVLDSYWVLIHVSIIVGSYGPFFVGAILGILSLLLMILTTESNKKRMDLNIKEITVINEMALTIGLVMLTIGNFLGGMWANESWGRYWGWDPKETWALVSIMVYAFVIHMRLVPGLRSRWWFNLASVLAIYSVLMTYFGVNFYLKGLHSYASGDKVITPNSIYYSVAVLIILGALSYWRNKVHYQKVKK
ncbi:cytochrome C biogenesis protein [Aquimarina sp. AD10]|uniref:cytochrome c biogenesis protein n=1 Tax=Aquimarina sp. AD10 TaxID=1714849 RepID=UPI000E51FE8C|nr:cytochrome c biogenesis protein CcsA [Aquimarina sp. AD10]AXT60097.1 cytochrome C biogenesis protein [Aquimarina sp. AD10]RKN00110.1 cytochrome C biogenesis protein [Aquimarina sp. AD10]